MKPLRTALLACLLTLSMPSSADPAPPSKERAAALKTLEARAGQGDAGAQRMLGLKYTHGLDGLAQDLDKGRAWLTQAGENGDTEAQFELAMLYFKGLGVERDFNKGLSWLRTAAKNGHTHAQLQLANSYGIARKQEEQIYWLKEASKKDDFHAVLAQEELAEQLYRRDRIDEALEVYRQLSQRPSQRTAAHAMVKLARHYARQPGDSAQKQAFDWYKQAADRDNEEAQFKTGMGYYTGKGTPVDKRRAAEYFLRAANAGLTEAQYMLAAIYQLGEGVDIDLVQAAAWHRKAADQGYALSQLILCMFHADGQGVKKSPEQAYGWCRKAAEQGESTAQYLLGKMYETGSGIARDEARAMAWYGKAAAQKNAEATERLAALKRAKASASASGQAIEPKMIPLPAGQYLMGSPGDENGRSWWEPAPRAARVAAFELAEHEVTFDEWDACVADGGCAHKPSDNGWGRGGRPVINVNLADIEQYLAWLNRKTGQRYRLPTDAEWEYAARAGGTTPFHTGACLSTGNANYKGHLAMKGCPEGQHREQTLPVKSFAANAWGFHDMHGNVAERTHDCWLARDKPKARPDCAIRAIRGGSWNYSEWEARSGYLAPQLAELRYTTIGFRLAR
jgi:TPR repeat protein